VAIPELWAQPLKIAGNSARQLLVPAMTASVHRGDADSITAVSGPYGSWPVISVADEAGPSALLRVTGSESDTPRWTGATIPNDADDVLGPSSTGSLCPSR
jgi:hypothetical protein